MGTGQRIGSLNHRATGLGTGFIVGPFDGVGLAEAELEVQPQPSLLFVQCGEIATNNAVLRVRRPRDVGGESLRAVFERDEAYPDPTVVRSTWESTHGFGNA